MVSILRIVVRVVQQMFSTICDECGHKFSNKDALCHDWQEPDKAFGCPNCHTFYVKEDGKLADYTRSGISTAGILTPASMILGYALSSDQNNLVFLSCAIIISWVIIVAYPSLPFGKKLVRSDYQPGIP